MEKGNLKGQFIQKVGPQEDRFIPPGPFFLNNQNSSDSSGRICGYDQDVIDKPFLMYYNPLSCLDSGLPGEVQGSTNGPNMRVKSKLEVRTLIHDKECPGTYKVCINECPNHFFTLMDITTDPETQMKVQVKHL